MSSNASGAIMVEEIAREIDSWLESAVGDMGYSVAQDTSCLDSKTKAYIKDLQANDCRDIGGALADYYYNDEDMIYDLIADRIHNFAKNSTEKYLEIVEELLQSHPHNALKNALMKLKESHKETA